MELFYREVSISDEQGKSTSHLSAPEGPQKLKAFRVFLALSSVT